MGDRTLDLNRPADAKAYVLGWVDDGGVRYEAPLDLLKAPDEDFLRIAKQLFMYVDPRPAPGGVQ